MNKYFKSVIFLAGLLISLSLCAQDIKYSWSSGRTRVFAQVENLNKSQLALEDLQRDREGLPMRIAMVYPLEISLKDAGTWQTMDNSKKVWKLTIDALGAYGIIVRYKDFYIPKGAKLYVYAENDNNNAVLYLNEDNPLGGRYSTETLSGSSVTLEYVMPDNLDELPRIEIDEIGYCYKDLGIDRLKSLNDSRNSCMINVNCSEAANWANQKKGVVRIQAKIGNSIYSSSGSLVNNTNKDKTPYVLSAYHCFYVNGNLAEMSSVGFYFNDEFPACENESERPDSKLLVGAQMMASAPINGGSDVALVKLTGDIPSSYDVFFNGWNRENKDNTFKNGAVIHHPNADVKKISFYAGPLTTDSYKDDLYVSATDAHWKVRYSNGSATAGGSSGSPIFNQDGLIVGTLTGGDSQCSTSGLADYYGKFSYHWNQNVGENQQLAKYLDPTNSGVVQLVGIDMKGDSPIPLTASSITASFVDGGDLLITNLRNKNINKILVTDMNNRVLYSKNGIESPTYTVSNALVWGSGVYVISVDSEGISTSIKVMK